MTYTACAHTDYLDPDIYDPDPEYPPLFEWQELHVDKIASSVLARRYAKDGSDTGTGKTIMACDVARRFRVWKGGCKAIPICPKPVVSVWDEWLEAFDFSPEAINYEKIRTGKHPYLKRVKTRDKFQWDTDLLDPESTLLIFDEDHKCKGDKSLNSLMLVAAKRQGFHILLLGATSCNDPREMKALGFVLGMHHHKDFWTWAGTMGCRRGNFGGLTFNHHPKVLKKIHNYVYGGSIPRGSRISIKELGDKFPANQVSATPYDVTSPKVIDKIYEEMRGELAELEERRGENEDNPLTIQLRARQKVELLKVPTFIELARDAQAEGNAVVIFVSFRQTLDALNGEFSGLTIHGGQSTEERQDAIIKFQHSRGEAPEILVCQIQSGGVGISLHDEYGDRPRVSLISPTFSAIDLKQALGRIHRATGKSPAIQKIVFAAKTVEEGVCRSVRRKLHDLSLVTDGDLSDSLGF